MKWLANLLGGNTAADAIRNLESWEEEADALLPNGMSAAEIAHLEATGFIVDLVTGEVSRDPDADNVYGN